MIEKVAHRQREISPAKSRIAGLTAASALLCIATIGVAFIAAPVAPAYAQKASKTKAADSSGAQATNDQAEKLIEAGNAQGASNLLTSAISAGKLPPSVMARSLYLRGVANRKLQKQAQAISDLTSALWLKGGLNDNDRADALKQRSAAYADAGLAEPGAGDTKPPAASSPARQASRGPVASRDDAASPAATPAPSPAPVAVAASPETGKKSEWAGRGGKAITPPTPPPRDLAFPQFPSSNSSTQAATSSAADGSSFFGSLFGSPSKPAEPAAPAPVVAAPPPPAPAPVAAAPEPKPQKAAQKPVKRPTRTASAEPADKPASAPVRAAAARADGAFHARVALVRTQAEADTIAAKLKSQFGGAIAGRSVGIDQASFGNMGKFYQVKISAYASQADAQAACEKLKTSGLDCVPVDR